MNCETESDYIEYGKRLYREKVEAEKNGYIQLDFSKDVKWPLLLDIDAEESYRRGFQHGFCYAVELLSRMPRNGYSRITEVSNILGKFDYEILLPWRYSAARDVRSSQRGQSGYLGHPSLKVESWWSIRKRIFERDGFVCVECGSDKKLQCDHIVPVCDGGIAEDDNLQTLCRDCNMRKGTK